jgi:hypothetical protein
MTFTGIDAFVVPPQILPNRAYDNNDIFLYTRASSDEVCWVKYVLESVELIDKQS